MTKPRYLLTKTFRFESAHRLAKGYEGKCANIHGHSWNGSIEVACDDLDKFDMGVDYGLLGKYGKRIDQLLDHAILLHDDDQDLINLCHSNMWKQVKFRSNPTSETIARYLFDIIKEWLLNDIGAFAQLISVTINETCTTACRYEGN